MSMTWMRTPGQTWPGAAASFLGMWVVMMVAMMLPSLVPMLWRYRQAVGRTDGAHLSTPLPVAILALSMANICRPIRPSRSLCEVHNRHAFLSKRA